ncbi:uncharacterized protein LOC141874699 isoform X1 [Acropora palmata]|uniref:uncharacterized protein LOC141874699 isoform X1 n=1 Tax=Acropora palmata TaxID=6131 RepID=UPI003DA05016
MILAVMDAGQSLRTEDQINRDELSSQAAALLQTWRENVDRRTSVSRTFVHLRREDASRKAIPRRSRMQCLIQEGRVKDIEFSTRHTTGQIANLLSVNMPTLAGVDPTSITLLKSMKRGSEMTRVFRGLTNRYNIHNAFRQRSTKVFIDSGALLNAHTSTVTSTVPSSVTTAVVTENASTSSTMTLTPVPLISPPTTNQEANLSATPSRTPESAAGGLDISQVNAQDLEIVSVRSTQLPEQTITGLLHKSHGMSSNTKVSLQAHFEILLEF